VIFQPDSNSTLGNKTRPGARGSKDEMKVFIGVAAQRIVVRPNLAAPRANPYPQALLPSRAFVCLKPSRRRSLVHSVPYSPAKIFGSTSTWGPQEIILHLVCIVSLHCFHSTDPLFHQVSVCSWVRPRGLVHQWTRRRSHKFSHSPRPTDQRHLLFSPETFPLDRVVCRFLA